MHIFLIRHGQSIANTGENYPQRLPDHLVSLTETGLQQARENGEWLANYCKEKNIDLSNARILRTMEVICQMSATEVIFTSLTKNILHQLYLLKSYKTLILQKNTSSKIKCFAMSTKAGTRINVLG